MSNIEKHQLDALLEILSKAEELGINNISELTNTIESEILSRQLNYEIMQDLDGESEQVEFKQGVPTNFRNIAKTIAAFASTEGGRIYIGIEDSGEIIGIETKEENWFDKLQLNIDNFVCGNIQPTPRIGLELYTIHDKFVVQIRVPKGSEPLYYLKNIPYVRRLSSSKPATPSDVKRLHLNYFIKTLEGSVSE